MRAHKADTNGNREGVCAAAKNSGGERGEGRLQADGAYLSLPCSRRSGDCAPSVTRPRRGIRVPGLGLGRHSRGQQAAEARPAWRAGGVLRRWGQRAAGPNDCTATGRLLFAARCFSHPETLLPNWSGFGFSVRAECGGGLPASSNRRCCCPLVSLPSRHLPIAPSPQSAKGQIETRSTVSSQRRRDE